MFRTKDIYAKICNSGKFGHTLTKEELAQLQQHLMKMYKDIEAICDRHGLQISLAYGNVIGAIRHNGWIPWDDDLDLMMPREDYDKLMSGLIQELPGNYISYSVHTEAGPYERFAKIVDSNTVYSTITGNYHNHEGVFVDIFPIDNFDSCNRSISLKKYLMMFLSYTASSVRDFSKNNPLFKELMCSTKEGKRNYWFRKIWGTFFSPVPLRKWYSWIDSLSKEKKQTAQIHVPVAQMLFYKGADRDIFFPPIKGTLADGTSVYLPHKPEEYLDTIYKDWRVVPEESDRWHHFVKNFYINPPEPDSSE